MDLARRRANLQQLENAFQLMQQQLKHTVEKVAHSFGQQHANVVSLKSGLDSSEFNLRAHQKVLNALAIDLEDLRRRLNEIVPAMTHETRMVGVEVDGGTLRRVDWAHYHEEVSADLKALVEAQKLEEERVRQEAEAAKAKEAVPEVKEEPTEALPEQNAELPEGAAIFGG